MTSNPLSFDNEIFSALISETAGNLQGTLVANTTGPVGPFTSAWVPFIWTDEVGQAQNALDMVNNSGGGSINLTAADIAPVLNAGEIGGFTYYFVGHERMTTPAELGGGNFLGRIIAHEVAHVAGFGHLMDTSNGTTLLPGAGSFDSVTGVYTPGTNPLDDTRYTVMSYLNRQPSPEEAAYGNAVTYMALDIAAFQLRYGVDNTTHLSNTSYSLTNPQTTALDTDGEDGTVSIGRAYYGIWDAGGTDTIRYDGSSDVLINLNAATLKTSLDAVEDADLLAVLSDAQSTSAFTNLSAQVQAELIDPARTAGGFFSYVLEADGSAIDGGYTIAYGAEVEIAAGRWGDDLLIGNALANSIYGNYGDDAVIGGAGDDLVHGGHGNDEVMGGDGNDRVIGHGGDDTLFGGDGNDRLYSGAGTDIAYGGKGDDDVFLHTSGDIAVELADEGYDRLRANFSTTLFDNFEAGNLLGSGDHAMTGNDLDNWINGNGGNNALTDDIGNDRLQGGAGDDVLDAGDGNDVLFGGTGADRFVFATGDDQDVIFDFEIGTDKIDLIGAGTSYGQLSFTDLGNDVLIGYGQDSIVVKNVEPGQLTADNFIFNPPINWIFDPHSPTQAGDTLTGTDGELDLFIMTEDVGIDLIVNFESGLDIVNVNALGAGTFADLNIVYGYYNSVYSAVVGTNAAGWEFFLQSSNQDLFSDPLDADDFMFAPLGA